MLGELNEQEIEDLLKTQSIGRIGCSADGITYIVPLNYFYDGSCIYAHSGEGMKINMMRKNPEICFQTDIISNITEWESVVAWGKFEEITDISEMQNAMQKIINHLRPLINSEAHPSHGITERNSNIGLEKELIIYKIMLTKKTGRYERS